VGTENPEISLFLSLERVLGQPPEKNFNLTASEGCSGSKKLETTYLIAESVSNGTADASYPLPSVHHLHYVKLPTIQGQIQHPLLTNFSSGEM